MNKDKIHKVKIPIYNMVFVYSASHRALSEKYNIQAMNDGDYDGYVVRVGGKVCMYLPYDSKYTVNVPDLAHEAFHAAMAVSENAGIKTCPVDDEAAAYLAAWFAERVLDFVNKAKRANGKKKNKGKK